MKIILSLFIIFTSLSILKPIDPPTYQPPLSYKIFDTIYADGPKIATLTTSVAIICLWIDWKIINYKKTTFSEFLKINLPDYFKNIFWNKKFFSQTKQDKSKNRIRRIRTNWFTKSFIWPLRLAIAASATSATLVAGAKFLIRIKQFRSWLTSVSPAHFCLCCQEDHKIFDKFGRRTHMIHCGRKCRDSYCCLEQFSEYLLTKMISTLDDQSNIESSIWKCPTCRGTEKPKEDTILSHIPIQNYDKKTAHGEAILGKNSTNQSGYALSLKTLRSAPSCSSNDEQYQKLELLRQQAFQGLMVKTANIARARASANNTDKVAGVKKALTTLFDYNETIELTNTDHIKNANPITRIEYNHITRSSLVI